MNQTFDIILCVEVTEMPTEVRDYLVDDGIDINSQNNVIYVNNDDNVFAEWLKVEGYEFKDEDGDWVAIIAL